MKQEHPASPRYGICVLICVCVFALSQCEAAVYPFYLRITPIAGTSPVFITIIDQSGSMTGYQQAIQTLVSDARPVFLDELYEGDDTTMAERYFVVGWPDGESWAHALSVEPSQLLGTGTSLIEANAALPAYGTAEYETFMSALDTHPNRFYIFYGNGSGVGSEADRTTYVEMFEEYRLAVVENLSLNRALLVRAVEASSVDGVDSYALWAKCVVEGAGYDAGEVRIKGLNPPMAGYGWYHTSYTPGELEGAAFVKHIIDIAEGRPSANPTYE